MKDIKIAIVSSSFRSEVANKLEENAIKEFLNKGASENQIEIIRVPGSWEIPLAVKKLAKQDRFDAILTFGAIVKGETYHFEQISNELSRALMNISLEYEIPVIFEVWSVYKLEDAIERATRKKENKGTEAAATALKMIETVRGL